MIWWGSLSLPLPLWIYGPCEPRASVLFCFIQEVVAVSLIGRTGALLLAPVFLLHTPHFPSCLSLSLFYPVFSFLSFLPPPSLHNFFLFLSLSLTLSFFRTFSFSGRQDAHPVICLPQPRTRPLLLGPWFPLMGNSVLSRHTVLGVTVVYLPLGLSRLMWWTRAACGNSNLTSHKIKKSVP